MRNAGTFLQNFISAVLVICAILVTASVVYRSFNSDQHGRSKFTYVPNWKRLLIGRPVSIGSSSAQIKIIEFSDYQCPYCRELEPQLIDLAKKYPARFAIVRYNFPLVKIHSGALPAAVASVCAGAQHVYYKFQQEMFRAKLINIKRSDIVALARSAHVPNVQEFKECLGTKSAIRKVDQDIRIGKRIGVTGTPTMIINGKLVEGFYSAHAIREMANESHNTSYLARLF